jgi:hypothetical protein
MDALTYRSTDETQEAVGYLAEDDRSIVELVGKCKIREILVLTWILYFGDFVNRESQLSTLAE